MKLFAIVKGKILGQELPSFKVLMKITISWFRYWGLYDEGKEVDCKI